MNELLLSPRQILRLTNDRDYLFGEVIQAIWQRQLYWFRPLFVVEGISDRSEILYNCNFIDLRQSSDLLLPQIWFEDCLDTEIIPLLARFYSYDSLPNESLSRRYLYDFIRSVWQKDRQLTS